MWICKLTDDAMSSKWPESARDEGRSEVVLMLSSNIEDDALWGSQSLDMSLSSVTPAPLDCSCSDTLFPSVMSLVWMVVVWMVAMLSEEPVTIWGTANDALYNLSSTVSLVSRIMSWSFCSMSFCAWVSSACQSNENHILKWNTTSGKCCSLASDVLRPLKLEGDIFQFSKYFNMLLGIIYVYPVAHTHLQHYLLCTRPRK